MMTIAPGQASEILLINLTHFHNFGKKMRGERK